MVELIVGGSSAIIGLLFTLRGLHHSIRDARALQESQEPEPEGLWDLIREDLIREVIIGFGQILLVSSTILLVTFERPRPVLVAEWIKWSIVLMPVVLGLLSLHSDIARRKAEERIREKGT